MFCLWEVGTIQDIYNKGILCNRRLDNKKIDSGVYYHRNMASMFTPPSTGW